MKKLTWLITLIVGSLLGAGGNSWAQTAFFSDIRGTVTVVDATGGKSEASYDRQLSAGERVSAGGNGFATITYYTGREVDVNANGSHTIGEEVRAASGGSHVKGSVAGASSLNAAKSTPGATRGDATPAHTLNVVTPIYPAGTAILEKNPMFKWQDSRTTPAQKYVVVISDAFAGKVGEFSISGKTEAAYPISLPALEVDIDYSWIVKTESGEALSAPINFSVFDPKDQPKLDKELAQVTTECGGDNTSLKWYLNTANVYESYRLMKPAEETILKLIAAQPKLPQAHMRLAQIYDHIGLALQAEAARKKAESLLK